ncbi:MAG: hypothetical protein R6U00_10605 [Prochlorococcaceae cyanobacterium]
MTVFDASVPHSNGSEIVAHNPVLQIPIGRDHRSDAEAVAEADAEASLVLNQAVRDADFCFATELIPVSLREQPDLLALRESTPWLWCWRIGPIRRRHEV